MLFEWACGCKLDDVDDVDVDDDVDSEVGGTICLNVYNAIAFNFYLFCR